MILMKYHALIFGKMEKFEIDIYCKLWATLYVLTYCDKYRKIVSEYDQEIPQLQTADNPVAP